MINIHRSKILASPTSDDQDCAVKRELSGARSTATVMYAPVEKYRHLASPVKMKTDTFQTVHSSRPFFSDFSSHIMADSDVPPLPAPLYPWQRKHNVMICSALTGLSIIHHIIVTEVSFLVDAVSPVNQKGSYQG